MTTEIGELGLVGIDNLSQVEHSEPEMAEALLGAARMAVDTALTEYDKVLELYQAEKTKELVGSTIVVTRAEITQESSGYIWSSVSKAIDQPTEMTITSIFIGNRSADAVPRPNPGIWTEATVLDHSPERHGVRFWLNNADWSFKDEAQSPPDAA